MQSSCSELESRVDVLSDTRLRSGHGPITPCPHQTAAKVCSQNQTANLSLDQMQSTTRFGAESLVDDERGCFATLREGITGAIAG